MGTMEDLRVTECTQCSKLVECRSRIVNGTGPEDADVLFVGEGPGANEDEQGEPFVGRSGSVLDDQLRIAGLDRETVRITNCVRCRPPENRDPTAEELENCREYLETEIDRLDPEVIVTLGKVPSEHLLGRSVAVTAEAGSVEDVRIEGAPYRLLICVHPAATLYDRSQEETFAETIERAAELAGADGSDGGQTRLDGF
ncbi:uracil-DNA glycosylase [Halobiforma nitratireducens]|uniref:Type-4 uracil-DNA glycosylase n=1 Tax=Halobiforma nitratireducens JCM 10879 TaxID=1227454 RepID=M0LK06_9EURY|nr:uracil-DNA glycosylase [Halobiforma nitratireducens]EMA33388.1 phage SPO1 DNA polymerase-like protein [Halobiforma nitratireducens JCM 10879]